MKIIKEGKLPEKKVITCRKCKCEFIPDSLDIISDFKDGDYVLCPTCKSAINI